MRLLNVHSLQLEEFTGRNIPRYCILSHRWGEEEVSYKEFRKGLIEDGEGYGKITKFCEFVKRFPAHIDVTSRKPPETGNPFDPPPETLDSVSDFGIKVDWVWIDTCKCRQLQTIFIPTTVTH